MSYKLFAGIALVIGIIIIGGFSGMSGRPAPEGERVPNAWIEIHAGSVSLLDATGKAQKKLASGDELENASSIATDAAGNATVHFPNGSVLRLDKKTSVTLTESSYDAANGKLVVRATLAVGRVWSKIIELATPDSVWEVESSTAVATVRGTAFSMESDGKKARVITAENKVAVTPVDPKTKTRLEDKVVEVSAEYQVEITVADAALIAAGTREVTVAGASSATLTDEWFTQNQAADSVIETKVRALEAGGADAAEVRGELLEDSRQKLESFIKIDAKTEPVTETVPAPTQVKTETVIEVKAPVIAPVAPKTTQTAPAPTRTTAPQAVTLEIIAQARLAEVSEGTRVAFRAVMKFADGTTKDVTTTAEWGVAGNAGVIVEPGIFVGKVDELIRENGQATAVVFAIHKHPAGGDDVSGKSAPFTVLVNEEATSDVAI